MNKKNLSSKNNLEKISLKSRSSKRTNTQILKRLLALISFEHIKNSNKKDKERKISDTMKKVPIHKYKKMQLFYKAFFFCESKPIVYFST